MGVIWDSRIDSNPEDGWDVMRLTEPSQWELEIERMRRNRQEQERLDEEQRQNMQRMREEIQRMLMERMARDEDEQEQEDERDEWDDEEDDDDDEEAQLLRQLGDDEPNEELTPEERFVANKGICCPVCDSENFSPIGINRRNSDTFVIAVDVACNDCESTWRSLYRLFKIDNLEDNTGMDEDALKRLGLK